MFKLGCIIKHVGESSICVLHAMIYLPLVSYCGRTRDFSSAPVGLSADDSHGPPLLLKQELVSLTLLVLLSVDLSCVVSVGRLLILDGVAFFALLDVL